MGIEVSIVAGADRSTSSVQVSGSVQHVITEKEKVTFGVVDASLKEAVAKYFGKKPNDVYLHSPTPWGDLYKTYGWSQVQTYLTAEKAEITSITSEPTIIAKKTLVNNSSKQATFDASISDQVSNTVESYWSSTDSIEVSQTVTYKVTLKEVFEVGGQTSFSYGHTWGKGGSESKTTTVGSTSGVTVTLDPGEAVEARLTATRGVMKVRITYKAYLIGQCAVNYNPTYKGHHFWALGIGNIMSAAGLQKERTFIEDIEVGYYTNDKVEIVDKKGELKQVVFLADQPGGEMQSA